MAGKVCKRGHSYGSYMTACPYCVPTARLTVDGTSPVTPPREEQESVTPTRKHCPTCTCGETKIHSSPAERQRAYRERSR